jgi:perosamine synthetase
MDPERRYWFPVIGFNYRMTNVAAAIGCAQLEQLPQFLARRQEIADRYDLLLRDAPGVQTPVTLPQATRVNWLYTVLLPEEVTAEDRDAVIAAMAADGIETRPVFYPMHQMPPYRQDGPFPVSDMLGRRGLSLPTHVGLPDEDIDHVVQRLLHHLSPAADE